ncbi:lipoyl(octanoyl) transferase LipB [Phaeocystidibacter marisrubri]|uniref:Octanoyltransferase n=1 Tax=Phaeocystidibacter marisrubri TaxID=1577780 RepID=A0A6L3ZG07_9FLAO|nr:lipoyl(octanoyl) transferase LipB [Phaeocystidibacter marisrubri]KAB2816408.1 lipoyl(octanoyl) transferase LipB [Phaeocystidibacter marisrubri]GGH68908.1 octanoyltransferase [Phaeocystidibacter marisrubri]
MREVRFEDLGIMRYKEAWDYQEVLFDEIVQTKSSNRKVEVAERVPTVDKLLFVHHPHVYTLGKSGKVEHLLISEERMREEGIDWFKINRGGDITYHGPGQLVGYPIFDLDEHFTDIHKYLRYLEEAIILTLADYGLKGERSPGETGVWLDVGTPMARKICAMGVRASRWVTMHGFAFNINVDLKYFDYIVPCGIADKAVASLDVELGYVPDMDEVKARVKGHLADLFNVTFVEK